MFRVVEAENLFSWKALNYNISKGISQITGYNFDDNTPEGAGKSSIPNILCWTLYGKVPKDVKIDDVLRKGCKSGWGRVTLIDGTAILRSRKPNDLSILYADGTQAKGKDAKETQEWINVLIGFDFETFCQTVYFAQGYPKRFITASEAEKAKILSELQDLTIFDRAIKSCHELNAQLTKELTDQERQLDLLTGGVKVFEGKIQALTEVIETFEAEKGRKTALLLKEIDTHNIKYDRLAKDVLDTQQLNSDSSNTRDAINTLNLKIEAANKNLLSTESKRNTKQLLLGKFVQVEEKIKFFQEQLNKLETSTECPTCGHPLSSHNRNRLEGEIRDVHVKMDAVLEDRIDITAELGRIPTIPDKEILENEIKTLDSERKTLDNLLKTQLDLLQKNHERVRLLDFYRQEVDNLHGQIKVLDSMDQAQSRQQIECWQLAVTDLYRKQLQQECKIKDIKTLADRYAILKTGFKQTKAYVFRGLLEELSAKATDVLTEFFDVPVVITFTNERDGELNKILTNVSINGEDRALGLYSGGQFRRISLAVDLALAGIIAKRIDKPLNFRIFDEPFVHLSDTSIEKIVSAFEKLGGSTMIIEHSDAVKNIVDKTFHVELKDGVTRAA